MGPGTTADVAPIEAIRIGERDRTDLGNVAELAESIKAVGLLHPIVITADGELVAGGRRLAAIQSLGWTETPVTVVDWSTAELALKAEADENTCREPLTAIEASRARERRARILAPAIQENKGGRPSKVTNTAPQDGFWGESEPEETGGSVPPVSALPDARKTRSVAAVGTGYSPRSIDKVDEVRRIAERGVTTIGTGSKRREVEVPEPVRETARKAVTELAKPGTRIAPAHREVRKAMDEYLADDPELTRLTLRRNFVAAQSKAADITSFDAGGIALALEKDADWDQLHRLRKQLNDWFDQLEAARPRSLRIVGGSK
jgi:ParB family chromosome partitioning protein